MQKAKKKILKNGLRIITVPMKDNPTVTVLVPTLRLGPFVLNLTSNLSGYGDAVAVLVQNVNVASFARFNSGVISQVLIVPELLSSIL